jgi:hypothetical protein
VATHHRDRRVAAGRQEGAQVARSSTTVVSPSNRSQSRDWDRPNQRRSGSGVLGAPTGEQYERSWLEWSCLRAPSGVWWRTAPRMETEESGHAGDRGRQNLKRSWWLSQLKGAGGRGAGESPDSNQPQSGEALVAKNHVITAVHGGANHPHGREADGVR